MPFDPRTLDESQKEACAVSIMRAMLEDESSRSGTPFPVLLGSFASSRTYSALFDFTTRLWAEGPDYLRALWQEEAAGE